jgi:hypothetical protein
LRSYLVLTPPGGADQDHRRTLILPDGFAWLALPFTWIWLIWNRLWAAAVVVFLLQAIAGYLMQVPGFMLAGGLLHLAISLLVALEGRNYRADMLIREGWTLEQVIAAPDMDTAEDIYFAELPSEPAGPLPAVGDWARKNPSATRGSTAGSDMPFSLFDHQGGR